MVPVKPFNVVLIKPSHYDDNGYVIQWERSAIPSNSLAALYGLAMDCAHRRVLGEHVPIHVDVYDETNTLIPVKKIIRKFKKGGGGVVAMVGVQTNQFPRAVDLGNMFHSAGIPVVIGGFHVSGCFSMLPEVPVEIQAALAKGLNLFAGEAEGHLEEVLKDAHMGRVKPVYNFLTDNPSLQNTPRAIVASQDCQKDLSKTCQF